MSDERQAQQLLLGLDRPRALRPDFDAALRRELFDTASDAAATDLEHDADVIDLESATARREPRPRRSRRWLLAAALVALLVIGSLVAVTQLGNDDDNVATRSSGETAALVGAACARFHEHAFTDISRARLLGPRRGEVLQDPVAAGAALVQLERSLTRLTTDVRSSGLGDSALIDALTAATMQASLAVNAIDADNLDGADDYAGSIERHLTEVEQRFVANGIPGCP